MKKNILLLLGLLISCNLFADVNHPVQTICDDPANPPAMPEFRTNNSGNEYVWSKQNGNSWTEVSRGTNNYTPSEAGKYKCEVTTTSGAVYTGNLITYGGFNFAPSQIPGTRFAGPVYDPITNQNLNPQYELDRFNSSGHCDSGYYTTSENPNQIKEPYFCKIKPFEGSHMLVVDGETNSNAFTVFYVRELRLKRGQTYEFSCQVANIDSLYHIDNHGENSLANLRFLIKTQDTNNQWKPLIPDNGRADGYLQVSATLAKWEKFEASYTAVSDTYAEIKIENTTNTATVAGNDFVIDEIYFGATRSASSTTIKEFFELKIDTKPVITMPTIDKPCPNESVSVTPTVTNAGNNPTYSWSIDASGSNLTTTITSDSAIDGEKTGKLTVTNGVCTSSAEITIKTKQCNDAKNINHNITACPGEKVTLTLDTDITGATNYKWSHDSSITATSSIEVIISENIPSYICTFSKVENGIAIDYTETFAITLSTNCVTTLEEDHYLEACPEQEVTLTCNHSGSSITWLHDNSISTTTIKVNTNPIEEEIDEYTCVISNTINGQTTTYKETFHVKTSICKDKNSEESNVLLGSNITLSSQYSQTIGATYKWYKIEEDGSKTLVSTDASITFPANEAVTYECITKLPDGYTITETRKVEIYTLPVITPMKFFSPNGDDVNDLWLIDGIESAPNAYIRIYDRYSKVIYQCKGSEFGGWDGKFEGKDMIQDDYWYVISVPETEEQISGHFTLKR